MNEPTESNDAVRVAHRGGIPDRDLDAGELLGQLRGGALVALKGGQPRHPLPQPSGRRAGARADLQHLLAEVHLCGHDRQHFVLDVRRPLRAAAELVVVGVHTADATVRRAAGLGRNVPSCVAGWTSRSAARRCARNRSSAAGDAPEAGEHQGAVIVATFPMPAGLVFDWHTHAEHQLAWAASGVLTVRTGDATWVLPPTRALWIPAGLRHETLSSGPATMRSLYIRPDRSPVAWAEPTPVAASQLLAEMIGYLGSDALADAARARAEAVLADLLQPVAMATIDLRLPERRPGQAGCPRAARSTPRTSAPSRSGAARSAPARGRWPAGSWPAPGYRSAGGARCCGSRRRCPRSRPASRCPRSPGGPAMTRRAPLSRRSAGRPDRPPPRTSRPPQSAGERGRAQRGGGRREGAGAERGGGKSRARGREKQSAGAGLTEPFPEKLKHQRPLERPLLVVGGRRRGRPRCSRSS